MKKLLLSLLFLLYSSLGFSQLVEGFENTSGISGPLPATWTLGSGNWTVFEYNSPNPGSGTGQFWGINAFSAGIFYEGSQCASVNREGIIAGNTSEDYLVTPPITIENNAQLHFYTRMFTSGNQGTKYRIVIAPAFIDPSDPGSYTLIEEWTEDTLLPPSNYDQWAEKTIDLSDYVNIGIPVYIAFVREYTSADGTIDGDRWMIDNVRIDGTIDCYINVLGTANYSSPTTVDLSWSSLDTVEVMILPCSATNPTSTDNGIAVSSNTYQFTNLIPDSCYKVFIKNSCPVINTWHPVSLSHQYAPINLVAFVDTNNNGIKDLGEQPFSQGSFTISRNNQGGIGSAYSYNGAFIFIPNNINDTFDFGYTIYPMYSQCTSLGSFNYDDISVSAHTPQTLYFPVVPVPGCFDNIVYLSASVNPRPDTNDYDYLSIYTNSINSPASGTLTYIKAPNTTIYSTSPSAGVVYTPTGFTYDYSGLAIGHSISMSIMTSVPPIPTVNLNDLLTSSASISFSPADNNLSNNTSSITQTVQSSFDPNDINESHGPQIQFDQFSQNDYLTYTIRFQNTGNANAIRVRVDNVLDSRIDENSIEMIAARHDYIMVRRDNTVSWEFNNIQLPPASVNEDLSNGFITFRVKLKPGFAIGDIIPATASIYFDSNPAIVTETFNTEFVEQLGNPNFDNSSISLSPNPANDIVTINSNSLEKIAKISIYDVTGKRIYSLNDISDTIVNINVSHFAKGIYLAEILSDSNSKITKKLILK
ncbi:MAG: T9SS type A sorting domain-containing protein [Flavobacterium sp. JAD_PAG50586_2]|nr:MAG: T9SS type A sorting domain-containing protein [Flavobacterium sp. JAD_PAG50586_2]